MDSSRSLTNADPLWMVSPFNECAHSGSQFAPQLRIADCTLRDGERQPGVIFTAREKLEIARQLDALGVYEIEAGTPAASHDDRHSLVSIVEAGLNAKISAPSLPRNADIDLVKSCGAWAVRLSLPIGYLHRPSKLKLDDDAYLELAIEVTSHAREQGLHVIFSPCDTTRCDLRFLQKVLAELEKRGTVDRIRLVDTVGCATPDGVRYLVGEVRKATQTPLEIHCHNDFGLAVANTIAGAQAGAEYLSVTINGIGERSGNASLEETAVALLVLYGSDCGLDTTRLTSVSRFVEQASRVKPHESGSVVAGLLKQAFTAEPYAPHLVGQTRKIVLGKKSGVDSIGLKLSQLGYAATDSQRSELLGKIKEEAIRTKASVPDGRFSQLASDALSAKPFQGRS